MIDLALLWHHHQPDYRDRETGVSRLPWVRLHGIKDYYGLAALLREFPGVCATFNLVPSLLLQLDAYARGEAEEVQLTLSRSDPASLDETGRGAVLDFFFSCPTATMIDPRPRYRELLAMRRPGRNSAREIRRRFSDQDIRDLQVLYNLVWFHPIVLEERDDLRALEEKGRDFTEDEKHLVLDAQREVLEQVIPLHRELWDAGRIELITSPLYHPILPLLVDGRSALEAMPDAVLPARTDHWADDALRQLRLGVEVFERHLGRRPVGLWPSEGSVSQALLPLIAEVGYRWLATDEGILARSLGRGIERDEHGIVRDPDLLYRMYRLNAGGRDLAAVFRDREISDAVGFRYSALPAEQAVDDFMARLESIKKKPGGPHLVSVILDGENAWEHFPRNGIDFLRGLYRRLEDDPEIRTVTPGAVLEERPPDRTVDRLFAGSWIFESFGIWVGHDEDNRAWEMLGRAREELLTAEREGRLSPEAREAARDALHSAQGSDWFWWFGPDHNSDHADEFDRLFRGHLRGIYRALGRPAPASLDRPVIAVHRRRAHSMPLAFIHPHIDGRATNFFEWLGSAEYDVTLDRGVMDLPATRLIEKARFGFDREVFYLRVDPEGSMDEDLAPDASIRVIFLKPHEAVLTIRRRATGTVEAVLTREGEPDAGEGIRSAVGRVLEVAVPFSRLEMRTDDEVRFTLETLVAGRLNECAPRSGTFAFRVPRRTFDEENWQV